MITNARIETLASYMANQKYGTFAGLEITKVGKQRGPKGMRKTYNNDRVHNVLITGFKYENLLERSLHLLQREDRVLLMGMIIRRGKGMVRSDHALLAIDNVAQSLQRSLDNEQPERKTMETLVVDEQEIRGCYIAKGIEGVRNGTVYLHGLRIASRIVVPAKNGHWPTKSKPQTVANSTLRKMLPVGRYASYRLAPSQNFSLKIGGQQIIEILSADVMVPGLLKASAPNLEEHEIMSKVVQAIDRVA